MAVGGAGENDVLTASRVQEIGFARGGGGVEGRDLLGSHRAGKVVQRHHWR